MLARAVAFGRDPLRPGALFRVMAYPYKLTKFVRVGFTIAALGAASCTRQAEQKETRAAESSSAREVSVSSVPETSPAVPAATGAGSATAASGDFFGAELKLADSQGRPLECRGIAKAGEQMLVQRAADKQQFVVELARLSAESRATVAAYADTRAEELRAFVDARDFAAAKRSVKVEMVSASWCGWCTKTKEFFAKEKIPYQVFDHESLGGKRRQQEWGSTGLPTVKIGEKVIRGYSDELYLETLLAEYRKTLAPAGGS